MNDITLTTVFMIALATSVHCFSKRIRWMVTKIAHENCKKPFSQLDIATLNITMFISIILWGVVFYHII